jgi:hypothetical protein
VRVSGDGVQARTALGELTSDRASAAPEEAVSPCGARDPKPGRGIEQPSCMNADASSLARPDVASRVELVDFMDSRLSR